jgi:hypothetical protein
MVFERDRQLFLFSNRGPDECFWTWGWAESLARKILYSNKYCFCQISWLIYRPYGCIPEQDYKVKVKYTLVQALRLCTGRTAYGGSRGIALLIHDHGTRRGWEVSITPRPLFTPGKDPVPIVQEAGWAPGPVWTGAENLAPTGIRSPDRSTRSQSLYRLRYPAHRTGL